MGKPNKPRPGKKSGNSPSPRPPAKGSNIEGQPDAQSKANDCRYVKQEPPNVYVNIPAAEKEKKWQWNLGNKIAFAMFIVTAFLAIFTYLLFEKAGIQANEAIRASNAADSVLTETKREFNLINEPIIQLFTDSTKPRQVAVGQRIVIDYVLVNLKDVATKVISTKSEIIYFPCCSIPNFDTFKMNLLNTINIMPANLNKYITKESPIRAYATGNDSMTMNLLKSLDDGSEQLFFLEAVKFRNLSTNTDRFSFIVLKMTLHLYRVGYSEIVRNEID